jgi:hypothetical protein
LHVGIDEDSTDARAIGAGVTPARSAYIAFQPAHVAYAIPISVAASAFEISPARTRSSTAARRAVSWEVDRRAASPHRRDDTRHEESGSG